MELTNNELFERLGDLDTKIIHELDNEKRKRLMLLRNFIWDKITKDASLIQEVKK